MQVSYCIHDPVLSLSCSVCSVCAEVDFDRIKMVTARFPGIECEQPSTSWQGEGNNPTVEAENEVLGALNEANWPHDHDIGLSSFLSLLT